MQYVKQLVAQGLIHIRRVPLEEARMQIHNAWEWALQGGCFTGLQAQGPDPNNAREVALFQQKRLLNLLASLGFASGQWNRPLQEHIRQPYQARDPEVMWIPAPHAARPMLVQAV